MKTVYVSPKIQVFSFNACGGILMASNNCKKMLVSSCLCPHIPETKCELYCEYIKRIFDRDKETIEKLKNGVVNVSCPYKDACEDYLLYQNFINDKQRQ